MHATFRASYKDARCDPEEGQHAVVAPLRGERFEAERVNRRAVSRREAVVAIRAPLVAFVGDCGVRIARHEDRRHRARVDGRRRALASALQTAPEIGGAAPAHDARSHASQRPFSQSLTHAPQPAHPKHEGPCSCRLAQCWGPRRSKGRPCPIAWLSEPRHRRAACCVDMTSDSTPIAERSTGPSSRLAWTAEAAATDATKSARSLSIAANCARVGYRSDPRPSGSKASYLRNHARATPS